MQKKEMDRWAKESLVLAAARLKTDEALRTDLEEKMRAADRLVDELQAYDGLCGWRFGRGHDGVFVGEPFAHQRGPGQRDFVLVFASRSGVRLVDPQNKAPEASEGVPLLWDFETKQWFSDEMALVEETGLRRQRSAIEVIVRSVLDFKRRLDPTA